MWLGAGLKQESRAREARAGNEGMSQKAKLAEKAFACDFIDRNAEQIALLNDSVFYFGELGMQEYETAGLLTSLLEENGFAVERNLSGFPTGFCAAWGEGSPVIAIHTEYDANPDNSQKAGVTEPACIVDGAPGHCEGHNANAAVVIAGAVAAKQAMEKFGIKGRLKVFGAPAEEQLVSRPYFVRDGHFDDVDVALTPHIGGQFNVGYGLIQSALISAYFTFHGESAHAGSAPWKGRDALDAVILMDVGMAEFREHMMPQSMCQRVITQGGDSRGCHVCPRARQESSGRRGADDQYVGRNRCSERGLARARQSYARRTCPARI
jgi:aminobenzoyl-glutamate utilization protein B